MATYAVLMKLTSEGAEHVEEAPRRIREAIAAWEALEGRVVGFCATMGEYDYVGIGEIETDELAAYWALQVSKRGYVTTQTMRGFTIAELEALLAEPETHSMRTKFHPHSA
jgi:uncharacterized protein with GYD domain